MVETPKCATSSKPGISQIHGASRTGNYCSSPQSAYQQPPPVCTNGGPVARNEASPRIIPLAVSNPYEGSWTIKTRVTAKGELRHYNNPRADDKGSSFDLLDSDGGEIRITCFNAVADRFYHRLEAGRVHASDSDTGPYWHKMGDSILGVVAAHVNAKVAVVEV
ncbi:hypothetical protein K2173_002738 [Erythroxylum novogranatense]|uniref:Uncharacterized protein n=1 Tax=Erythroxylum novogranatense TaxID=1862640 RepID=A0AAV8SPS9_9ROSI|nr:hypothetical protein K2173_002738 [Erythroxylum novogranatense]